jgi:hypothetical protein
MKARLAPVTLAALCAMAFGPAMASQTFVTASTNPSASATFTAGAGSLEIDLTNTLGTDIVTVAQAISGLAFNVTGWNTSDITNSLVTSGDMYVIASDGSRTAYGGSDLQWVVSYSGPQIYLSIFGGPDPAGTILPDDPSYPSANNSIAGNGPHNPFYAGTVHLSFTGLSGVTLDSVVSNVAFNFGTVNGNVVPGIPEPSTYALMFAGLAAVGFMARRRRQA